PLIGVTTLVPFEIHGSSIGCFLCRQHLREYTCLRR
ncbi:hypothetical protein Hypma_000384, partial [Hypsizygus marmoreus]